MNKLHTNPPNMPALTKDKAKDWQLEILMEKLRSKASQFKTLPEISKNVRMTLLEKRYSLDSVEKSQHQKCLDTLQHVIKVTGRESLIERLESFTRQLGLRFVVEASGVFIFSDMFYLEIILEASGAVKDVKIHHEGKTDQQSCTELVNCLSRGDFTDFTTQLEGFVSIYQLNAEKKVKCKAFTALESLEADLCTLAQLQNFMKEPFNVIYKSPVGILEKRRGGHPMKLTYFVSPYDLLNVDKHEIDALSIDSIVSKGLGYWVTVCMEGSAAHKLQTSTLITVNRSMNGRSSPTYTPITAQNSAVVPACFTLKLNKPMPMCLSLVRKIQQIQQWPEIDNNNVPQPLLNSIVNHSSDGKMSCSNNKGLFVTLPDQTHCYCMTENRNMNSIFVSSIPFTHPAHVPSILIILREQALFNTIIGSCVRPNSRQTFENMTMFEVSALSSTQISISLEHPLEECMATADFDLSDLSNLICRIQNPGTPSSGVSDIASEVATKVLNKTFSIPITLRAVIKLWERQASQPSLYPGQENFSLPLGSVDPGGHSKGPGAGPGLAEFGGLHQDKIKQEPGTGPAGPQQGQAHHQTMIQEQQGMWNDSMMTSNFQNIPPSDRVLTNIELTNILSDSTDKHLSGKRQKRKATDDLWKSGKRKVGANAEDSELMDASSCDSTSRSTPISQETEIATPNSGSQSDLELSNVDSSDYLANIGKTPEEFPLDQPETVDMEEILSTVQREPLRKSIPEPSPSSCSSIISDLSEKNMVPPNVSITPITTPPLPSYSPAEKRTGIEIIPLTQPAPTMMSTSITITPITPSPKPPEDKRDRKSSRSSKEDKEKKRKRKRDESPMGPPDKVPMKQDPLSKPVSVSIKPTESPPLSSTPTSPNMMRKFSPSPTSNRPSMSLSGKLSPSLVKPKSSSSSSHHSSPSPKNSPAHVPSSPKHSISSPKHHGSSPKHPSASGSGKPSISALKNAASSPSSKSSSGEKSKNRDSSREKDKNRGIISNTKSKSSSSLKVKPLDLNIGSTEGFTQESLPSPSGESKSNANLLRNRKGSLSAIVDKLNIKVNAQQTDVPTDLSSKSSSKSMSKDGKSGTKAVGDIKNSEYMVKTSSDGLKLTINKPRTKESKSSSSTGSSNVQSLSKTPSTSLTGSPKVHTGLKPGVNSGPASKKPQQQIQKSSSSSSIPNSSSTTYNASGSLKPTSKQPSSSSSSKMLSSLPKSISKPTTSPKTSSSSSATDLSSKSKDRLKPSKSSSDKSIFSSLKDRGKGSPTQNDSDSVYKLQSKVDPYTSALMMEGMMKTLDKNFQIPKLSDKKKNETNNVNRSTVDTKIFDMMVKNDIKYPLSIPAMNPLDQKIRNNMSMLSGKDDLDDKKKDGPQNLSGSDDLFLSSDPLNPYSSNNDTLHGLTLTSKYAPTTTIDTEALDFSKTPTFPHSPSVSVHIVNSRASSRSSSCIGDEDLLDEGLVTLGK
ncbi:mediator of RNA polymerase II transcription subunit 1 isoform X2 [Anthonomus grandis grandis]|uniref:mediator of RNA polymerase II transcription subunit 1 isoform X2 n=1 Tax=Anthonomus grandis grandis TaxID=2921223 RepID=UPI002165F713|nr:mediator of RNA polymerase II transcription subunit 1 isoform X2 [Anthonomus grandis grandis]